ncbi:MAG: SUF system Fe-S cluster assembly protein [Tepidisphaeraceae bacterium]
MSDARPPEVPGSIKSLTVLPHSGKVDQLRAEAAKAPPKTPSSPKKERPIQPHVNRISASPAALKSERQLEIEREVIKVLRKVFDPEIPVNIYDLGLIYDIDIDPEDRVHVRMTLTAPGCPVAGTLPPQVEQQIEAIEQVKGATVELVWEPQWTKEMMSDAAQLQLGLM